MIKRRVRNANGTGRILAVLIKLLLIDDESILSQAATATLGRRRTGSISDSMTGLGKRARKTLSLRVHSHTSKS